jgi:integrase
VSPQKKLAKRALPSVEWLAMSKIGRISERIRSGKPTWFLDFSPYLQGRERRLTADRGYRFQSLEHAQAILHQIRGLHARMPLPEAVAHYRQANARPNLVSEKAALRLLHVESSGDYEPRTISQYRRYPKDGGHFSHWDGKSIYEIRYDELHSLVKWLRERGLAVKSIRNILAAFRSFYSWLRRGHEQELPAIEFPRVKGRSRQRLQPMRLANRAQAMATIPEADRGIFLALKMGIRPGEARAARVQDFDFASGVLSIREALKGEGSSAPRGDTKTGEPGDYPVSAELHDWLAEQVPTERRFQAEAPLFPNPRTGRPYSSHKLREMWIAACEAAEAEYVPLYRATKHTTLTALRESGVSRDDVQALARHRDPRTTDIYDLDDGDADGRSPHSTSSKRAGAKRASAKIGLRSCVSPRDPDVPLQEDWRAGRDSNPRPSGSKWWALQDSNLGASGYEPGIWSRSLRNRWSS